MNYRVFVELETDETLSRELQAVLKTAISAIITDNAETCHVRSVRFLMVQDWTPPEQHKTFHAV